MVSFFAEGKQRASLLVLLVLLIVEGRGGRRGRSEGGRVEDVGEGGRVRETVLSTVLFSAVL